VATGESIVTRTDVGTERWPLRTTDQRDGVIERQAAQHVLTTGHRYGTSLLLLVGNKSRVVREPRVSPTGHDFRAGKTLCTVGRTRDHRRRRCHSTRPPRRRRMLGNGRLDINRWMVLRSPRRPV
jgi:hypothetical protein